MPGLWQLTRLSLMLDARQLGLHVTRCGLLTVLYLAVLRSLQVSTTSAPGLTLFYSQIVIATFYLAANAIFGFSQTITEEKEDGSLGLMRLAGVSPLAILLGKTLARLLDAGLLLAVQLPFTLVAVTLGGVSLAQVQAAYLALAAYLWLLSVIGIASSVMSRDGGRAARWTAVWVVTYSVPPFLVLTGLWRLSLFHDIYEAVSIPLWLSVVLQSSFQQSPFSTPVVVALVAGSGLWLILWLGFDRFTLSHSGEGAPLSTRRRRASLRSWAWPRAITGRDFRYLTGGRLWMTGRLVIHLVLMALAHSIQRWSYDMGVGFAWAAVFGGLFSLFDTTWTCSRLFREEIRDQTWPTLVLTPSSVGRIAWDKCLGAAYGLWPSILLPYLWILLALIFHDGIDIEGSLELVIGSLTIGLSIFAYLHLLVWLGLRFGWQATPLTLTVCFATGWLYVVGFVPWRDANWIRIGLFLFTCLVLLLISWGLNRTIVRRLTVLAAG